MKAIDSIVIHCTATKEGVDVRAADIDLWHRQRGWQMIGYNYVIDLDGKVEKGRPLTMNGAHCKGWNDHSIGVVYVGGLDKNGKPKDTRTKAQKMAMHRLVSELMEEHPGITQIIGHRDTSPDLNGNGEVEPAEWIKACPCFDVRSEFPVVVVTAGKDGK